MIPWRDEVAGVLGESIVMGGCLALGDKASGSAIYTLSPLGRGWFVSAANKPGEGFSLMKKPLTRFTRSARSTTLSPTGRGYKKSCRSPKGEKSTALLYSGGPQRLIRDWLA